MWNRWSKEYLRGLKERHNRERPFALSVGELIIIQSEERDWGK